jgi:hypothetical protein
MHPLLDDLSELKDQELETKILDLSKKYWIVRNPDVQYQITLLLNSYQEELRSRRAKAWEQQYQNRDKGLDKLINVN